MKKIFGYLRDYFRRDFDAGTYLSLAGFLAIAFWLNYEHDFKRSVLNPTRDHPLGFFCFFAFYALPYYFAVLSAAFFQRDASLLRSAKFWGISGAALAAMSLDNLSIALPRLLVEWLALPEPVVYWAGLSLRNLDRAVALVLPVLLLRPLVDRGGDSFYGLTRRGFEARPYVEMLLCMLPLLLWASTQESFLRAYPTYKAGSAEAYLGVSDAVTYGLYEITYAVRYVTIEIFFRGFLVLALARFLSRPVLLPMVALYAFWHFGKPFPEAVASIFAAYLLGVIALRTGTILGGIALHIGVALAMELVAYAQLAGLR